MELWSVTKNKAELMNSAAVKPQNCEEQTKAFGFGGRHFLLLPDGFQIILLHPLD